MEWERVTPATTDNELAGNRGDAIGTDGGAQRNVGGASSSLLGEVFHVAVDGEGRSGVVVFACVHDFSL